MQFDRIDQSFLNHATRFERQGAVCTELAASPAATHKSESNKATRGKAGPEKQHQGGVTQLEMCEESALDNVLAMLLAAIPEQWEMLVDRIVGAREKGCRVIAIAGHHAQEGRTTIARGIASVLRSRGRQVRCLGSSQELWRELISDSGTLQLHQDRHDCLESHGKEGVVLVDSGVWFSPGPFRKQEIASRVFGCDAVLLVRHADVHPCPNRQKILSSLGVFPIGEVVTFSGYKECGPVSREVLKSSFCA